MASKDSTTQGPTSVPIPSVTEPAASTKSPKPSSSSQLRYLLWPVVCLFQFGLIVGGVVWGRGLVRTVPVGPKQEMAQGREPAPVRRVASKSGAPPQLAGEGLERGDQLILEGNYEAALAIYQPPEADAAPPFHSSLQYRIGVCQEALGRWDQAISAYRAVSSHGATPTIVAAGQVGQARIWIRMRKLVEAKKLLCDLTLRSGHPGLEEHPLLADARFLLALTASLENVHNEKPGAANDALAAYTLTDWPLERVLKWADVVQARGDTKEKVQQKPGISVHRLGPARQMHHHCADRTNQHIGVSRERSEAMWSRDSVESRGTPVASSPNGNRRCKSFACAGFTAGVDRSTGPCLDDGRQ